MTPFLTRKCGYCPNRFPLTRKDRRFCDRNCKVRAWQRDHPERTIEINRKAALKRLENPTVF